MNRNHRRRAAAGLALAVAAGVALLGMVASPAAAGPPVTAEAPYNELTIDSPDPALTIRDLRALAERVSPDPLPAETEAFVVAVQSPEVSWADIDRLVAGQEVPGLRLVSATVDPAPGTAIDDLTGKPTVVMMKWKYKKTRFKVVITCKGHDCPPPPPPSS